MDPNFAGKSIAASFSGRSDIDQMSDTPNRGGAHHRRAQSETFFRFPDDLLLDDVVSGLNFDSLDIPPLSSDAAMLVDSSKSDEYNGGEISNTESKPAGSILHFRSLSADTDFFDGLDFTGAGEFSESERSGGKPPSGSQPRHRHRHSKSMDASSSSLEVESSLMMTGSMKKAMAPDRLAELALVDPKRAKRILGNRQSAARSKERKVHYTRELEKKVQTLQTEATNLSAQVTMLQRDTTGLTAENEELKYKLQAMEQNAHLRDALSEALREEVQRLKIAAGQIPGANGQPFNRALPPQYSPRPHTFPQFSSGRNQKRHVSQSAK